MVKRGFEALSTVLQYGQYPSSRASRYSANRGYASRRFRKKLIPTSPPVVLLVPLVPLVPLSTRCAYLRCAGGARVRGHRRSRAPAPRPTAPAYAGPDSPSPSEHPGSVPAGGGVYGELATRAEPAP